jgi:hypothetical protein
MRDNQAGIQAVFGMHNRVFGCALKRITLFRGFRRSGDRIRDSERQA